MRKIYLIIAFLSLTMAGMSQGQNVITFDNILTAKQAIYLGEGFEVQTRGYYEAFDGGSARYKVVRTANAPGAVDSGYVLALGATKRLVQIIENNELRAQTFGVKCGDITADRSNFFDLQNAVNTAIAYGYNVTLPTCRDTVYVEFAASESINILNTGIARTITIQGATKGMTVFQPTGDPSYNWFSASDTSKVRFVDVEFVGNFDPDVWGGIGGKNQALSISNDTLTITGGNSVILPAGGGGGGTDNQLLSIDSNAFKYTLSIEDGNSVTFAKVTDTDTDDQTLSFSSPNLSISEGNSVDLSALQDGTGTDDQTLTLDSVSGTYNLTIEGGNTVKIKRDTDTDDQTLTLDSTETKYNLSIESGNTVTIDRADFEVVPVILFIGESNSGGQALNTNITAAEKEPQPEVKIYNSVANEFQTLDIGTNNQDRHYNATLTDSLNPATYHGWENGLANDAASYGLSKIYLVKAGQGGSTIFTWDEVDTFQILAVQKIDNVTEILRQNRQRPKWYIWFSFGINDMIAATNTDTFRIKTAQWLQRLHGHMGQTAPVFATEINSLSGSATPYNVQLVTLSNTYDWFYMVETDDLSTISTYHWNAAGMDTIARRMGRLTRDTIGLSGLYAGSSTAAAATGNASFSLITSTATATDSINWQLRDNSVAQINMGSTTETVLTLLNPRTAGVPFYKIHFQGVTASADSVVFPNNVISYAGDSLKARILSDDVLLDMYYDGTNYWANDTLGLAYTYVQGGGGGGGGGGATLLLDTVPNAVAAYSFRELKTGIVHVARVRRSSDDSEANFTAAGIIDSLVAWVGAGNTGYMHTWYDQSGNGEHAVQSVNSEQSLIVRGDSLITVNGRPALYEDGNVSGSEAFNVTLNYGISDSTATMYAVTKFTTGGVRDDILQTSGPVFSKWTDAGRFIGGYSLSGSEFHEYTDASYVDNLALFGQYLGNTAASKLWLNGTEKKSTIIPGAKALSTTKIGVNYLSFLSEIVIYDGDRTADRSIVEGNINTHYSLW